MTFLNCFTLGELKLYIIILCKQYLFFLMCNLYDVLWNDTTSCKEDSHLDEALSVLVIFSWTCVIGWQSLLYFSMCFCVVFFLWVDPLWCGRRGGACVVGLRWLCWTKENFVLCCFAAVWMLACVSDVWAGLHCWPCSLLHSSPSPFFRNVGWRRAVGVLLVCRTFARWCKRL